MFLPAMRIASGEPIYGANVVLKEPFMYATYGPLYYVFLGLFLRLTGLVFWPGRLISLLATAATAFIIYRIVKHKSVNTLSGLVAVTIFIMMPPTWAFGALQRVDALGIFLSLLSIAIVLSSASKRHLLIAGVAATLAFLTKPTFIAAVVSLTVCFFLKRRYKEAGTFLLGSVSVLVVAASIMLFTDNGGYSFNLASAQTPFLLRYIVANVRGLAQSYTVFASLVIIIVALMRSGLRKSDDFTLLILVYLAVSGTIGLVTCGRTGASINYFYEFTTALALFAGLEFGKLKSRPFQTLKIATNIFLVMALLTELIIFRLSSIQGRFILPLRKAPLHTKLVQDLVAYVPVDEPVASDYQDLVMRAGRLIYFNDLSMYMIGSKSMQSCLQSYLGEKRLAALITNGQISLPGYRLVEGYGYTDPYSTTGLYSVGPLLYLRDDLWQSRAQAIMDSAATQ